MNSYTVDVPDAGELAGRRATLAAALGELGIAAAVVTDPRDFEYFTGVSPCRPEGPSPFTGPIAMALTVAAGGAATLVGGEPGATTVAAASGISIVELPTFEDLDPLRPRHRLGHALQRLLAGEVPAGAVVGVEPSAHAEGLDPGPSGWRFVEVETVIGAQRARKSPWEVERIGTAIEVCDEAQSAAAVAIERCETLAGVREAVTAVLDRHAEVSAALVEVSSRSAPAGGTSERLAPGALVLTDIAPRVAGYWGDSCHTRPSRGAGAASPRALAAVCAALVAGVELVRPGVRACDVDAAMRERLARDGFHPHTGAGGHGIGLDFHEMPRLTPHDPTVLQPSMVLALEPGTYGDNVAVRMEAVVVVVPGGCEVLSSHLGLAGKAGRGRSRRGDSNPGPPHYE